MRYVYIQSEPQLWTVGFYDPTGNWHAENDYRAPTLAASRVHWLNGGNDRPATLRWAASIVKKARGWKKAEALLLQAATGGSQDELDI